MQPAAIERIAAEIGERDQPRVLELGAGVSTVLLARAVAEVGGELTAIEHDEQWAVQISELLARDELPGSRVAHAPLAADGWYERERVFSTCGERIDVLVVDGPPAGHLPEELIRAPSLELAGRLAPGSAVFLDDVHRAAERRIAELWTERLGTEPVTEGRLARLSFPE